MAILGRTKPTTKTIPTALAAGRYWPSGVGEYEQLRRLGTPATGVMVSAGDPSLVRVDHPLIVFKAEEGTDADRWMTRPVSERLIRLAELVSKEWAAEGIRLRVTEAWDPEREHGRRSLHYEGRAVDLTTSDRDQSKYPKLGSLAIQAGFAWVYNERDHIHASA